MGNSTDPGTRNKPETPAELRVDEAIRLAVALQQQQALDDAEAIYRRILAAMPDHPDALHFFGVLQYHRGQTGEAVRLITAALRKAPHYVDAHINLGNIWREQDRLDEAETCYRRALQQDPENAGAYNNLGTVLRAKDLLADAEDAYRKAIELAPDFPGTYENMGNLLSRQGRVTEAVAHYAQAIVLNPDHPDCRKMLGIALSCLGRIEEAADVFRQWSEKDPHNPVARHLLAACSGKQVPARAPDAYVRKVFDNFAGHFEARLQRLDYHAPRLVAESIARGIDPPGGDLEVLDAGCGTGLCGRRLRPYACRLDGVDLSPAMLARARKTGFYDTLIEAELTDFLAANSAAYDWIVSADTLCYFGDLREVMVAAAGALRSEGRFVFTVESDEKDTHTSIAGYRLNPNGRYCHRGDYVHRTVSETGLELTEVKRRTLRSEMGLPVVGLVVTAVLRRPKESRNE